MTEPLTILTLQQAVAQSLAEELPAAWRAAELDIRVQSSQRDLEFDVELTGDKVLPGAPSEELMQGITILLDTMRRAGQAPSRVRFVCENKRGAWRVRGAIDY